MAVAIWAGQTSSGALAGALGGLLVAATEERHNAVVKGTAKKAEATRVRKSRKAPKVAGFLGRMEWRYIKDILDTNIGSRYP